jgi:nicotinamidase-related amidase
LVDSTLGPIRPTPSPARLDSAATTVAVLDLTLRCDDPAQVCSQIVPGVAALLGRARQARAAVIFTGTSLEEGKPEGRPATALGQQSTEPLIFPPGYDKFTHPEFKRFLDTHNTRNLVIVGSSTHVAVMYTASTAARLHGYEVFIPLDGVNTRNPYEHGYALHQLQVIPGGAASHIHFTTLDQITLT